MDVAVISGSAGLIGSESVYFFAEKNLEVIGIDISQDMISKAKEFDPEGEYKLVQDSKYDFLGRGKYGLVQSIFTFDNIPGWNNRINILKSLAELLSTTGKIICLDANSKMYTNEWASFTTKDFPKNKNAKTGEIVEIIMTDVEDRRPVEDILWTLEDYYKLFDLAGLKIEETYEPLGLDSEPFEWKSEKQIPPWYIFVTKK